MNKFSSFTWIKNKQQKKHHSKEPKNEKLTKVKKQYQNMNFITSKEI